MNPLAKKALLIPFGLAIGLLLSAISVCGWRALRPGSQSITTADHSAVRKMLDEDPRALYQFDEVISYRPKPNFVGVRQNASGHRHATNSLGLLGNDEVTTDDDVAKVLFLGDSVTYGDGVPYEACFTTRVAAQARPRCQVMNASCCGWSTHQELGYFTRYLSQVPWDLLVLVVCLNDSITYDWVWDPQGHLAMQDHWPLKGLRLLDDTAEEKIMTALLQQKFNRDPATAPLSSQDNSLLAAWDKASWEAHLETVLGPFVAKADRPPLAIVVMPTRQQLTAKKSGAPDDVVFAPQRTLARFCERHQVPLWDASREVLLDATIDVEKAYRDVTHLSEEGHRRIAAPLWNFLKSQLPGGSGFVEISAQWVPSNGENDMPVQRR